MQTQPHPDLTELSPTCSVLDHMVAFMLDHVARDGGVTTEDLENAGFSRDDIGDHGSEAATIARRRMIRQLEDVA